MCAYMAKYFNCNGCFFFKVWGKILQRKKTLFGLRLILNDTEYQKAVRRVRHNFGGKGKASEIYIQVS